jgi:hypothetical protein
VLPLLFFNFSYWDLLELRQGLGKTLQASCIMGAAIIEQVRHVVFFSFASSRGDHLLEFLWINSMNYQMSMWLKAMIICYRCSWLTTGNGFHALSDELVRGWEHQMACTLFSGVSVHTCCTLGV